MIYMVEMGLIERARRLEWDAWWAIQASPLLCSVVSRRLIIIY